MCHKTTGILRPVDGRSEAERTFCLHFGGQLEGISGPRPGGDCSSVAECCDTWARSEIMAARGHPGGSEASPAMTGLHVGRLAVETAKGSGPTKQWLVAMQMHLTVTPTREHDALGDANGSRTDVANNSDQGLEPANGSDIYQSEPQVLSRPEMGPEAPNGPATSHAALPNQTDRSAPVASAVGPCRRSAELSGSPVRLAAPTSVTTVSVTTVSVNRRRAPK